MFQRFIETIRHPGDHLPHVCGTGGLLATLVGAIDANSVYTWGGVLIALFSLFLGTIRQERGKRNALEHAEEVGKMSRDWLAFITAYRMKQIETTGKDPFANGPPPFDPREEHREVMEAKEPAPA